VIWGVIKANCHFRTIAGNRLATSLQRVRFASFGVELHICGCDTVKGLVERISLNLAGPRG
jgi:hypothetical protein